MRRITLSLGVRAARILRAHFARPRLELLEDRVLPAGGPFAGLAGFAQPLAELVQTAHALASPFSAPYGFSPAQISQAYGFNQISFNNGTIRGDGSGQTIAIVDAYSQPNIGSDLQTFDATFGLPAPPSFQVVNQNGGSSLPSVNSSWGLEISLDVEWAHAVAPGANILLIEANTNNYPDLLTAINFARSQQGVSVVSLSWGGGEWSSETSYDGYFTTPEGHQGITFVASSGDSGSAGAPEYPSVSGNVLAVGGTQLSTDNSGNYLGETAWSGSGGGISTVEAQPAYQRGVVTQTSTYRAMPDVSYDGSPNSPFAVYDSSYPGGGWLQVYGTSAGAPQWAALVAIADQGRALEGKGTLDGASETLPTLYQLPQSYFRDITSGNNGSYSAGPGYDLVTGRGSPVANLIVNGLVAEGDPAHHPPWIVTTANASSNPASGTSTNLSVLGNDTGGAASLTYSWSILSEPSGVNNPTFSSNGTNAAQNTTVTFASAGTYTFQVTITDPYGYSVTSDVSVTVNQTLSSISLTPTSGSVYDGNTLQFTATALDQFGHAMNVQPNWTWTLAGSGSLDGNGNFTAPALGYGMSVIYVQANAMTQTATVSFQSSPFSGYPWLPPTNDPGQTWSIWVQFWDNWFTQLQSLWQSWMAAKNSQ
jgi:subtilase family serine protease